MKRKCFLIIFFLAANFKAYEQERINTDRPDQTESATLTPRHFIQAEFGFHTEHVDADNYFLIIPEGFFKYGVSDRFELQLATRIVSQHQQTVSSSETLAGLTPVILGIRVGLWEQKKILPKTSAIIRAGLPFTAAKSFQPDHMPALIILAMENDLTNHLNLGYNVGVGWKGDNSNPFSFYSISFGFDLGKKWDGFAEGFGNSQDNSVLYSIDAGIGFFINDNMKLDSYYGNRISKSADRNFFGVGYSIRINTCKNKGDKYPNSK